MKVVIYTRNQCAQCEKAKRLLDRHNIAYEELSIDVHKKRLLESFPNLKVLPVVFMNNVMIGSLFELEEYFEHERLEL